MPIANAKTKDLIPLYQAVRTEIPSEPSAATVWRWVTRGLAPANDGESRIKLEVLYVGSRPHTTRAAIRDFINRATQARLQCMERTQQRQVDVTEAELAAVGLIDRRR